MANRPRTHAATHTCTAHVRIGSAESCETPPIPSSVVLARSTGVAGGVVVPWRIVNRDGRRGTYLYWYYATLCPVMATKWSLVAASPLACPLLDSHLMARHESRRTNATGAGFFPQYSGDETARTFTARRLLNLLAGRTLVLLGDSVTEQHFHSLACALLGSDANHSNRTPTWWPRAAAAAELWKTRTCIPFAHEFVLCYMTAGKVNELNSPRPWILSAKLRQALQPTDIVLLNVGVHFHDASAAASHYEQLAGPLLHTASTAKARTSSTPHVASPSLHDDDAPVVIFRETAPQHFAGGVYPPTGSGTHGCVPLPSRWADAPDRNKYNEAINPLAKRDGVPVLRIWASSALMHADHLNPPTDCTHWILPGVPDHWTEQLYAMLRADDAKLLRPIVPRGTKQTTRLTRRWAALRRAFVALPGCVYHQRPRTSSHASSHALSRESTGIRPKLIQTATAPRTPRGRQLSARALAAVSERSGHALGSASTLPCCQVACREMQMMPHGPPPSTGR